MLDVELLPPAYEDYDEGYAWYRRVKKSPRAAHGFSVALDEALDTLRRDPELGIRLDDEHRFYRLKRYPYFVVYRSEPTKIVVVAVSHDRREPGYWRRR